ncbi:chemotaxis protein CheA [Desulfovibrio inopinatus]|uniref:chemotaxis protein CheA n=1 Tax=Desulfovibrio inopinatus TaxID=102109 RepID=UPI00040D95F9|nr:chemotaxis protein CheA [Desulfovibrio inopinatus]
MSDLDAAAKTFIDEAYEQLADLEESLLELEENPEDLERVARAFRAMHTIKGSGAMFGFEEIARFTHDIETVYDRVRNGELPVTTELLTLTLTAKDHLHSLLSDDPSGSEHNKTKSDAIIVSFQKFLAHDEEPHPEEKRQKAPAPGSGEVDQSSGDPEIYWIRYTPHIDEYLTGTRPLGLLQEIEELGVSSGLPHVDAIPSLEEIRPDGVYIYWDILLATKTGRNPLEDVFLFVDDPNQVRIQLVGPGMLRKTDLHEIGSLCISLDDCDDATILASLRKAYTVKQQKISEAKSKWGKKQDSGNTVDTPKLAGASGGSSSSIRVDSFRLDKLINMVGEMVIIQSRLALIARNVHNPVLSQISEDLERLTDEMRDNALSIRMLPIGTAFSAFRRLVRDLAGSLGKNVELVTVGGETELDKTVIDRLKDPLMHILRNSIDHGLEDPASREAVGKPTKGTIRLKASHSSGDVLLTVEDDGRGIDPTQIMNKAVERGLVDPSEELSTKEIYSLLFLPGFSTAEKVSDVSGRGVGMDVVKKSIDNLRGTVDIDSVQGVGTTLTVRLPLTLAIIDGLNVLVGKESYVIPLASVDSCQERFISSPENVKTFETIECMGKMTPCISLRRLLSVPGEQPDYERIIIVAVDGSYIGLSVDFVVGRQQAVIKSLGGAYSNLELFSGTTVNADGGISLILDVAQLVRTANQRQAQLTAETAIRL